MEMPNIPHPIRDAERQVVYVVMAYRKLSRAEVVQMVRVHSAQSRRKPKKGSKVTIITSIGANEN